MEYGLLGEKLGHSFSPQIHQALAGYDYRLLPTPPEAVEELLAEGTPHGKICLGFTPDEEIGRGADAFDVKGFGADFAFTVDGGEINDYEYETFNAASAAIEINGFSIHPGSAKDKMKNALLIAMEFNALLPPLETPGHTEGYEGFFHLAELHGGVERARMSYIIRNRSMEWSRMM